MELSQTSGIHHTVDRVVHCAVLTSSSRIPDEEHAVTITYDHPAISSWGECRLAAGCWWWVSHSTTTHGIVDNATSI